jgi:hypothetical protein
VGGLDEKVSESVLWELFVQAGYRFFILILIVYGLNVICAYFSPVSSVNMPKDRITGSHQGYFLR